MDTRRWGLLVWALGMATLAGGWLAVALTDMSPVPVIMPIGVVLVGVGGFMHGRKPKSATGPREP